MRITRYTVHTCKNIKNDLRFALATDLHDKNYHKIIQALKAEKVDFIAVAGDLMTKATEGCNGLDFLREAVKTAPVFYSLGNHEYLDESDYIAVKKTGAKLLDDSFVSHNGILIGGLTSGYKSKRHRGDKETPPPDCKWLKKFASQDGFKLLLSHHPEYYKKYIESEDIDLTVSGHAHGGQWCFFGRGVYAPGQGFLPKYTSGIHDNRFIISRGLSNNTVVPRLFNSTELVIVNIIKDGKLDI